MRTLRVRVQVLRVRSGAGRNGTVREGRVLEVQRVLIAIRPAVPARRPWVRWAVGSRSPCARSVRVAAGKQVGSGAGPRLRGDSIWWAVQGLNL